jgi:hypothetical protein
MPRRRLTMELGHIPTVQLKQMIRKAEHELDTTGTHNAYCIRYRETVQANLDEFCKELGTREEC